MRRIQPHPVVNWGRLFLGDIVDLNNSDRNNTSNTLSLNSDDFPVLEDIVDLNNFDRKLNSEPFIAAMKDSLEPYYEKSDRGKAFPTFIRNEYNEFQENLNKFANSQKTGIEQKKQMEYLTADRDDLRSWMRYFIGEPGNWRKDSRNWREDLTPKQRVEGGERGAKNRGSQIVRQVADLGIWSDQLELEVEGVEHLTDTVYQGVAPQEVFFYTDQTSNKVWPCLGLVFVLAGFVLAGLAILCKKK